MRFRSWWILLGLAAAIPVAAGPAERAFKRGDLEKARRLYEQRLHKAPGDLKARYNLGNVEYRSKELKDAEAAWQAAMKSGDPALRARAAHNLGNARLLGGDTGGAIEAYRDALGAEPGSADTKYNLELALRLKQAQEQQQKQQRQQGQGQKQDSKNQQGRSPQPQQQQEQGSQKQQNQKQPAPDQQQKQDGSRMPAPQPGDYTRQEAERVLDGLKQEEKDLQADRMRTQGQNARVEKDW